MNALGLMSFPFPKITCPKGYAAREKLVAAFAKFYDTNGQETASHYIEEQSRISERYGFSNEDKARADAANAHAILANTTPTAFWTIYHIITNTEILEEVRTAVTPLLTITKNKEGVEQYEIDVTTITDIPILRSVFHESLRHYGNGAGARVITEDTLLDNQYLLKKDAFVFMPNRTYHFDPSSWGPTVNEFDPHRFMKTKTPLGAFRGFGGGVNLCPGRFFAMNGTLAMCAMLALRFDFKPVGGRWVHPGTDDANITLLVHPPKQKVWLEIEPRKELKSGSWSFKLPAI